MSETESQPLRRWLHRLAPLAMPAAYAAFLALVWWRLWTGIDGAELTWKYDPRFTYWGDLIFQYDALGDGHLALWNPYDRGGYPVYADPHSGFIYPPNWPLWLAAIFTGGVSYAFITIKIFAHWVFGCAGMHLFLRRQGLREQACYAGGLLFGFTCPAIRYGGNALNWGYAWIPWVLLALYWFSRSETPSGPLGAVPPIARDPGPRRGIILGTVAAMVLLSGGPAVVIYTLMIAVPYGIYLLRGRLLASARAIGVAAGVALLWMLPLVASNLGMVDETVRQTRTLGFIGDSVFTTGHVVSFLVPKLGEGENIYYGLFPILCAGALVASAGRARALVFWGVAVVGTLLAMGHHAGVLPSAASLAPPLGWFRRAHRYLYVVSVAMAALGGLGLGYLLSIEELERKKVLARRVVWVGGAATFALAIAYLVSIVISKKIYTVKNVGFGHAVIAAGAGTVLLRALLVTSGRRQSTYAWIAVSLLAVDLWTANSKVIDQGFSKATRLDKDQLIEELPGIRRQWRIYDRDYVGLRPGTRLRVRDFGGYEDDPLGLARWRMMLDAGKRNALMMGHANVRYWLAGGPRAPKPRTNATPMGPGRWQLIEVAPAVLYVPDAVPVEDPAAGLRALARIRPGRGAVVEGGPAPKAPPGTSPAAGTITVLDPNRVVAEIDAPGPGLVVIAESYFSPWSATLNGKSVPIRPANVAFRGIDVPAAGHYRIEMRLRPMRFWGLLPAYLIALGLFGWAALSPVIGPIWARRRRRASPGTSTPPSSDPPTEEESA